MADNQLSLSQAQRPLARAAALGLAVATISATMTSAIRESDPGLNSDTLP